MAALGQSVKVVIEHVSSISDYDEEGYEDCWLVVAYLDIERGNWRRATLHRCGSLAEATEALEDVWGKLIAERNRKPRAA